MIYIINIIKTLNWVRITLRLFKYLLMPNLNLTWVKKIKPKPKPTIENDCLNMLKHQIGF